MENASVSIVWPLNIMLTANIVINELTLGMS